MSDLRANLIRLAAKNPGLRSAILPLVTEKATPASVAKKASTPTSLRTAAIRFAHANPTLRKHVLAAIKEADEGSPEADKAALKEDADPASHDQNLASTWEKVGPSAE